MQAKDPLKLLGDSSDMKIPNSLLQLIYRFLLWYSEKKILGLSSLDNFDSLVNRVGIGLFFYNYNHLKYHCALKVLNRNYVSQWASNIQKWNIELYGPVKNFKDMVHLKGTKILVWPSCHFLINIQLQFSGVTHRCYESLVT